MERYDFSFLVENKIKKNTPIIATIGVFECFHIGHMAIMDKALEIKRSIPNSEVLVITFSTNPKPGRDEKIDTLRIREENLELYGIDCVATIDFSQQFSRISASEFLETIVTSMDLRAIVVGEDFKFGHPSSSRSAKDLASMLKDMHSDAKAYCVAPILTEGGEKISSTLLRRMIKEGRLKEFREYSGQGYILDLHQRPYAIEDSALVLRVKDIHQLLPPQGVYESTLILEEKNRVKTITTVSTETIVIKLAENPSGKSAMPDARVEQLLLEKRDDFS